MTLSCITNQDICIIRGQSLNISIPVTDADGAAVDLATATTTFGIAVSSNSAYILPITTSTSTNIIAVPILPADSALLTLSRYYYSAWVDIGTGKTLVARGAINVQSDSRTI